MAIQGHLFHVDEKPLVDYILRDIIILVSHMNVGKIYSDQAKVAIFDNPTLI